MLRKIIVGTSILAASMSVAFAADAPAPANYKGDYKGEAAPAPVYNAFPVVPYVGVGLGIRDNYASNALTYKGLDGNLYAGYGGLVNENFYLAGELNVLGDVLLQNNAQPGSGLSARSTWSVGASVLPGYAITDRLVGFLRIGVVDTRFSDQGNTRFGGLVGLGMQAPIAQCWDLRGEYNYAFYRGISSIGAPKSDTFNVSVIYKFI